MQKTITNPTQKITPEELKEQIQLPLKQMFILTTGVLVLNLIFAVCFVIMPSYYLKLAGYICLGVGALGLMYALYLINLAMNRASDHNIKAPQLLKHFGVVAICLGALSLFYLNYQGSIPYVSQNLNVTVNNTSYTDISEIIINYGGSKKVLKNLAQNKRQNFSLPKANGMMHVILKDKTGDRSAEFNITKEDFSVLLRIDWQKNIMPELR